MIRIRTTFALLCLAVAAPGLGAPRSVVAEAATLIENNYFDAAKAREIASDLRKEASAGKYDAYVDARDLASALTRRLRPLDSHFNVTWVSRATALASAGPSSAAPSERTNRRGPHGFRKVELLPGGIGYIDLRFFADFSFNKANEPARQMADAALALIADSDAVILDLRNNGGGSPAMVGYLVSAFARPDADIYNVLRSREGATSERPQEPYASPRVDVPLFVLISGQTNSAAESTAYTLQAARRATIVGQPSGGAANPGGEFPIGEGFNLFVSTATAINPFTSTNWERVGVQPDVLVAPDGALNRAEILALEAILAKNPSGPGALETRWVLDARRAEQSAKKGPVLADYVGAYSEAVISVRRNHLLLERGRRPAVPLTHLRGETFFAADDPVRRVLFEREADGKVKGFQFVRANGPTAWYPRQRDSQTTE
jgi:Peptidase family S41